MKYQVFIFFLISNMKIKFITSKFPNFQIVQKMKRVPKKKVRTYQCLNSTNIFFYSFLFPPFYYITLFRNSVIHVFKLFFS